MDKVYQTGYSGSRIVLPDPVPTLHEQTVLAIFKHHQRRQKAHLKLLQSFVVTLNMLFFIKRN